MIDNFNTFSSVYRKPKLEPMKIELFKTKINTSVKGMYPPFLSSNILLVTGTFLLYSAAVNHPFSKENIRLWLYLLFGSLILEAIVLWIRLPKETLHLFYEDGELRLEIWKEGVFWDTIQINHMNYWWNYHFREGIVNDLGLARSAANDLNLHIAITDDKNEVLYLKERQPFWGAFPNGWPYSLESFSDKEEVIHVFNLQKLLKVIQNLESYRKLA